MVLTVQECLDHANHVNGGPLVGINMRRVIDDAGKKMLSLRPWAWMVRPPVLLGTVAAQNFVTLPTDFGSIVTIEYTQGISASTVQSTFTVIDKYRSVLNIAPGYLMYLAVMWNPDTNGVPVPRLDITPTPQTTDANALTLRYRPRWVELATSDQTYVSVPDWIEPVFIQLVRATARGYQTNTMDAQIKAVCESYEWLAAVKQDEIAQYVHGELCGGALNAADDTGVGSWYLTNQALPPAAG